MEKRRHRASLRCLAKLRRMTIRMVALEDVLVRSPWTLECRHGPFLEFRLCPRFLFRLASIVVVKIEYQRNYGGRTVAHHRYGDI